MKIVYRVLVGLLIISIVGLGITAIVKSQKAIDDADRTIAQVDEFLHWCEHHGR